MGTFRANRRPRHRGFTLVELLVVVGIITVLAGMILVGVFGVRRKVDAVSCTANLHQAGLAIAMYIEDYKALPVAGNRFTREEFARIRALGRGYDPMVERDLAVIFGDYVPNRRAMQCPAALRTDPYPDTWRSRAMYDFEDGAKGVRVAQIRTPKSRAPILYDPIPRPHGLCNVLFLDGRVKAYKVLYRGANDLTQLNDGSKPWMWPPD